MRARTRRSKRRNILRSRRYKRKLRGGSQLIDKVILLFPVYPHVYPLIYNIMKKMKDNNITIDILLVFSTQEDYDSFEQKDRIKHAILDKSINDHSKDKFFQISAKRFCGYNYLLTQPYEYFISLDADIDIIPENFTNDKIMSKIESRFANKRIYGAVTNFGDNVKSLVKYAFSDTEYYDKLKELTKEFTLYTCWTDIPVVKKSDISDFLSFIKYDKTQINGNDFNFEAGFDFVYYDMFLLLKRDFKMIDITPITPRLEYDINHEINKDNCKDIFEKLKAEQYTPGWIHSRIFNLDPTYFRSEGNFIMFHIDRTK